MNLIELWTPVRGFEEGYEISRSGKIRSKSRFVTCCNGVTRYIGGRNIKQNVTMFGYLSVKLSKNGKTYSKFVHRLLAEAFLPDIADKRYINHRNGIKTDNVAENLEWVTHSENMKHAYALGLCVPGKRRVINKCTGRTFESAREAADFSAIPYSTLKGYLTGSRGNRTCLEYAS